MEATVPRANSASTSRGLRIQRTVRVFSIGRPVSRRVRPDPPADRPPPPASQQRRHLRRRESLAGPAGITCPATIGRDAYSRLIRSCTQKGFYTDNVLGYRKARYAFSPSLSLEQGLHAPVVYDSPGATLRGVGVVFFAGSRSRSSGARAHVNDIHARGGGLVRSSRQRVAFQTIPYSRCLRGTCAPPPVVVAGEREGDTLEHRYDYVARHGIGEAIGRTAPRFGSQHNKGTKAIIFMPSWIEFVGLHAAPLTCRGSFRRKLGCAKKCFDACVSWQGVLLFCSWTPHSAFCIN